MMNEPLLLVFCFILYNLATGTDKFLDPYDYGVYNHDEILTNSNHRLRRSVEMFADNITYTCDTNDHPQPTAEYPAVLFEHLNYNNCSTDGKYIRLRANDYIKWVRNAPGPNRGRVFSWRSMLVYPNVNVTFRVCCPSGNNFMKTVSNWQSTADLNLTVFHHNELQGNDGIWYSRWLHWTMNFFLRINQQEDFSLIPDCGTCYFGGCGLTGNCECATGYSGTTCEIRPANDSYPTQDKPLVLFKEENFQGAYIHGNPDEFKSFASNLRDARVVDYKSMRVLHNRTVTFARNIRFTSAWQIGTDVENLPDFMLANTEIANPIWYNYDTSIELTFYAKVEGNARCDNCSTTSGVCYTGSCLCMSGFTGENCDIPP